MNMDSSCEAASGCLSCSQVVAYEVVLCWEWPACGGAEVKTFTITELTY